MPANWITDRPSVRRRAPQPAEAPRLQLPLHQPMEEHARPSREPEPVADTAKRGTAVVDFYI